MTKTVIDQRESTQDSNQLDDIEAYVATFDEAERQELAAAGAAIDVAILLYRIRERRRLTQTEAAELAGLQQQAVSRFEQPDVNPQLDRIQHYLGALGYALELNVIDVETGESAARATLPPRHMNASHRRAQGVR